MRYEEVKAGIEMLCEQLEDPLSGQICPHCLTEFAYAIPSHVPRLRQDCHRLFDDCVLVFLAPRTLDDVVRLHRVAVMCDRHRTQTDGSPIQRLGVFLDSVEAIVSLGLHAGDQPPSIRALNTLKSFASRSGRWPARLQQLLPFGPEQAVSRLVELAEPRVAGGPIAMLTHCVIMARTAVLPVVLADAYRSRLVAVLRKSLTMDATKSRWREDPRSVVVGFVDGISRGPGALPRDFELLVAGSELELYRAVCAAVTTAPESFGVLDILADMCQKLYLTLGAHTPDARDVPPLPALVEEYLIKAAEPMTREKAYARLVHTLIRQAGLAPRCAAPGCDASALLYGDCAKLQLCSRCRVTRYCSKACQARAWKDDKPPHKAVCAVLCKFDAHQYVQGPLGGFDEQYARVLPQLSDDEVEVFNKWLTARRDEFGTISGLFVGPVDLRGVDSLGIKGLTWLALATVCTIVVSFACLPFAWAVLVTLLAVGFAIWQILIPFIPLIMLRYRVVM